MKKVLLVFIFSLLGLLTACGGNDNVATAVEYINSLEAGDVDTATGLVCPDRADTITENLLARSQEERASYAFENVSCAARGEDVACRFTVIQETTDNTPAEFDRNVVFEFDDGLICGFEEEVAS